MRTCVKAPSDRTTEPQPPHCHGPHSAISHGLIGPRRRGRAAVQVGARCLNLSHLPKHLGGRRETEGPRSQYVMLKALCAECCLSVSLRLYVATWLPTD